MVFAVKKRRSVCHTPKKTQTFFKTQSIKLKRFKKQQNDLSFKKKRKEMLTRCVFTCRICSAESYLLR